MRSEEGVVVVVERDVEDVPRPDERAGRWNGRRWIGFDVADRAGTNGLALS